MIRVIRNIFVSLLVALAVIYGGIKAYLYFQIKERVERVILISAPFVDLRYQGISTALDGAFYLENVSVQFNGFKDRFNIRRLGFITQGLDFLLFNGNQLIEQKKFPEQLGISIEALQIRLSDELIDDMMKQAFKQESDLQQKAELACSIAPYSQFARFVVLGMRKLQVDSQVNLTYNAGQSTLKLKGYSSIEGVERVFLDLTLENQANNVPQALLAQTATPISLIKLSYQPDIEFSQKANHYCADFKGVSVEQFIDQLVDQSDERYLQDIGIIPGAGIRSAITTLIKKGGELTVTMQPETPVDIKRLLSYQVKDIPQILAISAEINAEPITDLSFNISGSPEMTLDEAIVYWHEQRPGRQNEQPQKQAKSNKPQPVYEMVNPMHLVNYIDFQARILTNAGTLKTGQIVQVEDKNVTLLKSMFNGHITFKIPLADIVSSEIKKKYGTKIE